MIATEAQGKATHRKTSVKIQFSERIYIFINIKQAPSDSDVFYNYCPRYASTLTPY